MPITLSFTRQRLLSPGIVKSNRATMGFLTPVSTITPATTLDPVRIEGYFQLVGGTVECTALEVAVLCGRRIALGGYRVGSYNHSDSGQRKLMRQALMCRMSDMAKEFLGAAVVIAVDDDPD